MLFIGIHDNREANKNYWCFDNVFEQKEIKTQEEYSFLKNEFIEKYQGLNPTTKLIKSNESCVIYEFEKKVDGFNCKKKVVWWTVGRSLLDVQFQFENLSKGGRCPYTIFDDIFLERRKTA